MPGGVEWNGCPLASSQSLLRCSCQLPTLPFAVPPPHPVLCQLTLALPCPPPGKMTLSPIGPTGPGSTSVSGEAPQGNLSRSTS